MKLILGQEYKRTELHDYFGGSRQSGISAPAQHDFVFIFSSESGEQHGYSDGWHDNGNVYDYTGEGQHGDMTFKRGNETLRTHKDIGKRVFLMTTTQPTYVKYEAELSLIDWYYFDGLDSSGQNRKAIKFIFNRCDFKNDLQDTKSSSLNLEPDVTSRRGLVTTRVGQGKYRQSLVRKFNRRCAVTGCDVEEVLIASHIVPWRDSTDAERHDEANGILLSPALDALFDKHLISFTNEGEIIISSSLTDENLEALNITHDMRITVTDDMHPYLNRHRLRLRNTEK